MVPLPLRKLDLPVKGGRGDIQKTRFQGLWGWVRAYVSMSDKVLHG